MASNPLLIIPDFSLHFPKELSYDYLRFEGNGKIPLGRRERKRSALLAVSVWLLKFYNQSLIILLFFICQRSY